MKTRCPHNALLPKGLICDRGYLHIRISTDKGPYNRGCGAHTPEAEAVAIIHLNRIREQIHLGNFGLPSKTERIKFKAAREIFHRKQFVEYRDEKTHAPRTAQSIASNSSILNVLGATFDEYWLDAITRKDLKLYRKEQIEYKGISAGTLNRRMAVLGSLLSSFRRWVADEEIDPVRLPTDSPLLPDLEEMPRDRVASLDELKALKQACIDLDDIPMWSIIETELYTSLRLNDLKKLEHIEAAGGTIEITQSKTHKTIRLPENIKPNWAKVFINFRYRWEEIRDKAAETIPSVKDLQFRDLRKTGLRLLKKQFTDEQIAKKGGHSVEVYRKHYAGGQEAEELVPMIDAVKKLLDENT